MLLSSQIREFHHDWRSDGEHLIHVLLLEELLHTDGYDTLFTVAAVIGHDDHLVRAFTHLILEDNQILRTTGHHGEHSIASGLQCLYNGEHRCYTKSTTGTYDSTVFLNLRGITQRAYYVRHIVALVERTEFL